MQLTGQSFLGGQRGARHTDGFQAVNPQSGQPLAPVYYPASPAEIETAVTLASQAFASFSQCSGKARAAFLRRAAEGISARQQELAERAHLETALPMPRLIGEATRTANQLRLFADLVEEGSWVQARIDPALPDRKPLPRPDIRSMLRPIGPVAVFGASNFPLAFSVAGGDTASALAAGCPVIVKAHPAHPGTSEIAADILTQAVIAEGLPPGVFTLLFDSGIDAGATLVRHPLIRAVAFTGSLHGGRALMDLAAARRDPIPCFTEMSSGNPVFVLPSALRNDPEKLASALFASFTLGAGQFCTKPGIVLVPGTHGDQAFLDALRVLVQNAPPATLLTDGIASTYARATEARSREIPLAASSPVQETSSPCLAQTKIFTVCLEEFLSNQQLAQEIFGPNTLLVHCDQPSDLLRAASSLEGHLTATILGDDRDLEEHRELIHLLEQKAGRIIFNAFPTGVEVTHAMVHGGPYPATSDPRFTSVGSMAIYRFARPVCFQGFPNALLPPELQNENPMRIARLWDGKPEKVTS
jgi:alpha-ketoglutaric semialdehyde dehydrogenase